MAASSLNAPFTQQVLDPSARSSLLTGQPERIHELSLLLSFHASQRFFRHMRECMGEGVRRSYGRTAAMNGKIGSSIGWGIGAIRLISKNKIVTSCFFLIQGAIYLFAPVRTLRRDVGTLALMLALYAIISIVLVLTDSETVSKGQSLAGGLVTGFFNKKKNLATREQDSLPENFATNARKTTTSRMDTVQDKIREKHDQTHSVCKVLLLLFYILLLIVSVILFFNKDVSIRVVHVILGLLMITDSVMSIASIFTDGEVLLTKNRGLSVFLACVSIVLGIIFILVSWDTSVLATQIIGITLMIKSFTELVIAFRNREVLSSVKETIAQIKSQEGGSDSPTE